MMVAKKPTKNEKIMADNLLEEAAGIFESCIQCGMCKGLCPHFDEKKWGSKSTTAMRVKPNKWVLCCMREPPDLNSKFQRITTELVNTIDVCMTIERRSGIDFLRRKRSRP